MSVELKYIVIDETLPLVFPTYFKHSEVAAFSYRYGPVTSAGFIQQNEDHTFTCYGESISLKVKSDPKDSALITKLFHPSTC